MTARPARPRTVPCPTCRRPALFEPTNVYRPFCSPRCRDVDLGAWASEGYRVATDPDPRDVIEPDATAPTRLQ